MKKLIKATLVLSLTVMIFAQYSCQEDVFNPLGVNQDLPTFNMDLFEQNINDYVNFNNDEPIGWGYVISKDGLLARWGAFGDARTSADNQIDFSLNKEINVASITKFYTAIAAMQLIDANNLSIESKIEPWLPQSWQRGPGVNNLSFKDLLKHESGLNSINTAFDSTLGYSGLESCIADGVVNSKERTYLNVNFALFRVLIPSLWENLQGAPPNINIESSASTQIAYLWYMQEHVFGPIGLSYVNCSPEDRNNSTLYYNVNDDQNNANGVYYGSWSNKSGGGGYFMTPLEMAAVNAYFNNTEILLSEELKDIMKEHRLGMDLASGMEDHGKYYAKGGSISNGINQGIRGHVAMFPINKVDITIIMNTQGVTLDANNNSLSGMVYRAYNNAWE
ncbi:MAG: serine hydrolase [Bacteroidia bacterium]